MDIRSFFKPLATKGGGSSKPVCGNESTDTLKASAKPSKSSKAKVKRKIETVSSDSDLDIIEKTPAKCETKSGMSSQKSGKTIHEQHSSKKNVKTSVNNLNSDTEDPNIIKATPDKEIRKVKKRKIYVISSDSEEDKATSKATKLQIKSKQSETNLKPVNITDIFSKAVKQSKVEEPSKPKEVINQIEKKSSKKKKKTEIGIHEDKDFEKTLIDLDDDDDLFLNNEEMLDKTIEEALQKGNIEKSNEAENIKLKNTIENKQSEIKSNDIETSTPQQDRSLNKRPLGKEKENNDTPKAKKTKLDHTDSGIDDLERYEKRKYCAMQYQQYLNRSGPKNHGSKEIPKGKPNCLANLCFLRTGVLDSLDSEEFTDLIKQHGGRVVHSVTKKVNYVIVGEDAGPAKLQKAQNYGIPTMNEDELLDMILQKSGMPKKFTLPAISSFEDAGINDSFISSTSEETNKADPHIIMSSDDEIKCAPTEKKKKLSPVKKTDDKTSTKSVTSVKESTVELKVEKPKQISKNIYDSTKKVEQTSHYNTQTEKSNLCLSEKYKPTELKDIIGQQVNNSNMNRLKQWLECWYQNDRLRKQKKIPQPRPWDKSNAGGYFKCALLSGPPGVGKTTTATLVARNLGYDIVEFNASDTRSKRLLKEEVASALSIQNISSFNVNSSGLDHKRVLLMDEVDGMAGNEDRGGMQELISLIKMSKIPVICMCNDRNHQKMRSLANYCFDLRFEKPKPQQILGFVMSICCKEGIKITPQVATEIINGTACDIRQTLNQISMLANLETGISLEQAQKDAIAAKKDTVLGPWQVCKMVFHEADQKNMSLIDKSRLFFYDYSLGPLFVQENYLKVKPHCKSKNLLKHVAAAAEAISMGATIDKKIRESNNWSLLDMQAMFSSVLPGHYMSGNFTGPIDFPGWLGKNSKRNKLKRMTTELAVHTKLQTSGGALAMNLDYSKALLRSIVNPLKKRGLDGVPEAVEVMKKYQLLREDLDSLVELCTSSKQKNLMDGVESKVKGAFTRLYNKEVPIFSYSANAGVSKKKTTSLYDNDEYNDAENDEHSDTEETIESDNLVKTKKSKSSNKKEPAKPSTSKKSSKAKGKK